MATENMRARLKAVYKAQKWKDKVDKMHEQQVIAVYLSFKKRGLIK